MTHLKTTVFAAGVVILILILGLIQFTQPVQARPGLCTTVCGACEIPTQTQCSVNCPDGSWGVTTCYSWCGCGLGAVCRGIPC